MTMFPVHRQNLRKKDSLGCYGGSCGGGGRYLEGGYECLISLGGASDLMAEEESRREDSINNEEEEAAAGSSSSRDILHDQEEINKELDIDGGWLQLSLGGGHAHQSTSHHHQISLAPRLVELDLLPAGGSGWPSRPLTNLTAPMQPQPQHLSTFQVAAGSLPITATAPPPALFLQQHASHNSIDPMTFTHQQYDNTFPAFGPYYPLTLNPHVSFSAEQQPRGGSGSGSGGLDVTGPPPHMDLRVVDPPRRPHSGVWFILEASQNQRKEPYLPQLPKSYLRIKDGRMTVGLLIKYLVNKLKLDTEFEVEITCKGQQLLPLLTLQHVRDMIWNSRRNEVVVPDHSSATIDHLMLLNYGRIA